MRDGFSLQSGTLDGLLPGLWKQTFDATLAENQPGAAGPSEEPASLSLVLRQAKHSGAVVTVNLPLANTLFHNGRRTTLLASEWLYTKDEKSRRKTVACSRMQEKRSQIVELLVGPTHQKLAIVSPLVPITHPRKIVEGLGNILAKVEIDGQPSPASQEIQANIPRLLEARRTWSDGQLESGRVGVWALLIPEGLVDLKTADGEARLALHQHLRLDQLRSVVGKLAFEFENPAESTLWQRTNVLGQVLLQGGRLHKIRKCPTCTSRGEKVH